VSFGARRAAAQGGSRGRDRHSRGRRVAKKILQAACEYGADLIIVGKHGQNRTESRVIGSNAENLCEIARRPGLMVPTQDENG
jgi:nucleotide-binding universal stress UspA family protein